MKRLLKKIFRDNSVVNPIVRILVRAICSITGRYGFLTDRYRVYGIVRLEIEGVKFKVYSEADDFIANDLYYNKGYELNEFRVVKALSHHGTYFVDVGANTGLFSLFSARFNSNLKIICFEPNPINYDRLKRNIVINGLWSISAIEQAVGPSQSEIEFTVPKKTSLSATSSANHHFASTFQSIPSKLVKVKQTTLDNKFEPLNLTSKDLLKIDVEYYELEVLKGAKNILSYKKPLILIEILSYERLVNQFPQMKGKVDPDYAVRIETFLKNFGYYPYWLSFQGIHRVSSVLEHAESRNFLFVPKSLENDFYSFHDLTANALC